MSAVWLNSTMNMTWELLILPSLSKKRPKKTLSRPKCYQLLAIEPVHDGSNSSLLVHFLGHPVHFISHFTHLTWISRTMKCKMISKFLCFQKNFLPSLPACHQSASSVLGERYYQIIISKKDHNPVQSVPAKSLPQLGYKNNTQKIRRLLPSLIESLPQL